MARKKKNPLDDLTSMMSDLGYDNSEQHESVVDMDELTEGFTGVEDPIEENNEPDPGKQETEEKEGENKDEHDDDSKIPDDVLNRINNQSSEEELDGEQDTDDDNTKVDPNEAQQIGAFFDAFAEALDWDVKDEDRPDSIESLIDYIGDVVEQNSTPAVCRSTNC